MGKRELCLGCLAGVSWLLCGSSSRCHRFVCSLWLWYFLIILTYYFPIITTYNYKAVHFINTLACKGKRFVIGHLTVCMLVYSAVPEKSYLKSKTNKLYDARGKCNWNIRDWNIYIYEMQEIRPRGYKTFFMFNSTEHESYHAHKC